MAFNLQVFKTRTLTAIIFAAVMLTGLLWNHWSFLVLFSIIHFGCWWEYFNLLEKIHNLQINKGIRWFLMISGYWLMLTIGYNDYNYDFGISPFGLTISLKWGLVLLVFLMLGVFMFQNKKLSSGLKWACLFGFVYFSIGIGCMIDLYKERDIQFRDAMVVTEAKFIPLIIIASIWINDTMAYIVGSLIGRRPLSKVSPKKTWEGTIGGIILSLTLMFFLWARLVYSINDYKLNSIVASIALIASVTGTIGDLFESKLKRMAGVKDSGSFMPGHGGFLDRFDSLLFAVPAVWLFLYLILM
jgi:phosphatidate cytidylyltransferase